MSSTRKLGTRSDASSRRSSFGAGSTTSSVLGNRKGSTTEHSTKIVRRQSKTPGGPTITAPSTASISGPSSSSAALRRTKLANQTIQTQSSPPGSKQPSLSLQWSSTKVIYVSYSLS